MDATPGLTHVPVGVLSPERFSGVLDPAQEERFRAAVERVGEAFEGRIVWNVNSTAQGGGVAEMLRSLLAYARGAGVDARWVVIPGTPDFFAITKRIHNHLHGFPGDGGPLGAAEREAYRGVIEPSALELTELLRPGDVVIVHDPQPAGRCRTAKEVGAVVIWRCHVGLDRPNDLARGAWDFLRPHVLPADAYVFSRHAYAWEGLDGGRVTVVPPSIDAFSPKNQQLSEEQVSSILAAAGLSPNGEMASPTFAREDGSTGTVVRLATLHADSGPLPGDAPLVVQVSRWDRLKDPLGVLLGFATHVAPRSDAHLAVVGPSVEGVADDPEGADVLRETEAALEGLPAEVRARIHLVSLPMEDGEENAAIVNAIQRRADIVVQKSLAEGFGLTVTEAMWKGRPVIGTRIGGIQDQIVAGTTGLLLDDPLDLRAYGDAVLTMLDDPARGREMGREGQRRIRDQFLGPRHLTQYLELISTLMGSEEVAARDSPAEPAIG
jgi:trehalose synthase